MQAQDVQAFFESDGHAYIQETRRYIHALCQIVARVKLRRRTRAASCGASKAPLHEVGTSLS
jgi:hypothetical protein